MRNRYLTLVTAALLVPACAGDDSTSSSASALSGTATYRDATTTHDGAPSEPATPPPQNADVQVVIKGTGEIPTVDPQCALDPAGAFEAHYASTLEMGDGSVYTATVANGALQTPSGCAIPDLTVALITDVVVRAELAINTQNCSTFCDARARADAEAQCGATASSATCRADYETTASASCTQTCTTQAHAIVAEVSLATSLFGNLDADALRAAALGDISADLTFTRLEDADGNDL